MAKKTDYDEIIAGAEEGLDEGRVPDKDLRVSQKDVREQAEACAYRVLDLTPDQATGEAQHRLESLRDAIVSRLKRGKPNGRNPSGFADAVFFAGNDPESPTPKTAEPRALRYLRPMPQSWLAKHSFKRLGVARPAGIWFLAPKEFHDLCREENRAPQRLFRADERGIGAAQPEHRGRYHAFRVERDIWAAVYLG